MRKKSIYVTQILIWLALLLISKIYIDNNCYHVDVCWDDTGATEYEYFLRGNDYVNLSINNYRTWKGNYPFSQKNVSRSRIKPIKLEVIVK